MQDLLNHLLFKNPEIDQAVARYCDNLPEYQAAKQRYESAAEKVAAAVGFSLYNEFESSLVCYTGYEVYAYYRFGLGLRETLVDGLGL